MVILLIGIGGDKILKNAFFSEYLSDVSFDSRVYFSFCCKDALDCQLLYLFLLLKEL